MTTLSFDEQWREDLRRAETPDLTCRVCGVRCRWFECVTYVGAPMGGVPVHPRCLTEFFKQLDGRKQKEQSHG